MARGFPVSEQGDGQPVVCTALPMNSSTMEINSSLPLEAEVVLVAEANSGRHSNATSAIAAPARLVSTVREHISQVSTMLPIATETPSLEETRNVTAALFRQFCEDHGLQIDQEAAAEEVDSLRQRADPFDGHPAPCLAQLGRDLRRIADEFERSTERQSIKQKANQVDIRDMSQAQFRSLLIELFLGQFSRERIIVLFFFCTDLASRAYQAGSLCQFMKWSFDFIMEHVCVWVYRHGGWAAVLGNYMPRLVITAVGMVTFAFLTVYLKDKLWPSS